MDCQACETGDNSLHTCTVIDDLEEKLKESEALCKIYFDIAVAATSEIYVRHFRNKAIKNNS